MPEPNLPPLIVYEDNASLPPGTDACQAVVVRKIRDRLPELPSVKRDRLVQTYGILPEHGFTLVVRLGGAGGLLLIGIRSSPSSLAAHQLESRRQPYTVVLFSDPN